MVITGYLPSFSICAMMKMHNSLFSMSFSFVGQEVQSQRAIEFVSGWGFLFLRVCFSRNNSFAVWDRLSAPDARSAAVLPFSHAFQPTLRTPRYWDRDGPTHSNIRGCSGRHPNGIAYAAFWPVDMPASRITSVRPYRGRRPGNICPNRGPFLRERSNARRHSTGCARR